MCNPKPGIRLGQILRAVRGSPEWEYLTNELRAMGVEISKLCYEGAIETKSRGAIHIFRPLDADDRIGVPRPGDKYYTFPVKDDGKWMRRKMLGYE